MNTKTGNDLRLPTDFPSGARPIGREQLGYMVNSEPECEKTSIQPSNQPTILLTKKDKRLQIVFPTIF